MKLCNLSYADMIVPPGTVSCCARTTVGKIATVHNSQSSVLRRHYTSLSSAYIFEKYASYSHTAAIHPHSQLTIVSTIITIFVVVVVTTRQTGEGCVTKPNVCLFVLPSEYVYSIDGCWSSPLVFDSYPWLRHSDACF